MSFPSLTILIPTYNRSAMLVQTLDSLRNQTVLPENLRIVVSNDNSKDDTREVLERYRTLLPQMRVFHQEVNLKHAGNWEFLLKQADTDFVFLLCDDDAVAPDFLESYLTLVRDHPDTDMVLADIELRDPDFKPLQLLTTDTPAGFVNGVTRVRQQLMSHHMVMTTMYRRSTLLEAGGWDSQVGSHLDCNAFCRAALRARNTYRFAKPMLYFRINAGSWSHTLSTKNQQQLARWYKRKFELLDEDAQRSQPDMLPFFREMRVAHAESVMVYLEVELAHGRLDGHAVRNAMRGLFNSFPESRNTTMALKLWLASRFGTGWLSALRKISGKPDPYQGSVALFNSFTAPAPAPH